jgi:hypothetical protein
MRRTYNSITTLNYDLSNTTAFVELGVVWKKLSIQIKHAKPIKILSNPLQFDDCTVVYGTKQCTSCTICNNNKGFNFDCSNIVLNPAAPSWLQVKFPPTGTQCIGLPV